MGYQLMRANAAPETGYSPDGKSVNDLEKAVLQAREAVLEDGRRQTIMIEEEGTNNVWSVTYEPGPASVVTDADGNDSVLRQPGIVRVVYDGREQEVTESREEVDGLPVRTFEVGDLVGPHEVHEENLANQEAAADA